MTIVQQIASAHDRLEANQRSTEFIQVARCMAAGISAEQAETMNVPARTARLLKSAVSLNNPAAAVALSEFKIVSDGFIESLAQLSVFDRMLQDGMRKVPLRSRVFVSTVVPSGRVPAASQVKPISALSLTGSTLDPEKAAAIIVVSQELLKLTSSAAQAMFANELRQGVAMVTDQHFLSTLIAATTPIASAGSSVTNVLTDLNALLAALTVNASSKIYWILSPANLKKLCVKATSGTPDGRAFPSLTINGGEVGGITVLASDQLTATQALMVDARAIAGNTEIVTLSVSRESTLQLDTSPDSPPTAATIPLSLWQADCAAIKAERFFAFELLRTNAVASLSGVTY
jgi:hypothetical protein